MTDTTLPILPADPNIPFMDQIDVPEGINDLHELEMWLYHKAVKHAGGHFTADPWSASGDLRGFLGKEVEFIAECLGYRLPADYTADDVHPTVYDMEVNAITSAYEDVFGDDIYG